jgi:hypothetical protein
LYVSFEIQNLEWPMNETESFFVKAGKVGGGVFLSLLLGIVGGGSCGAAILVFGALIGRSGTTGTEYIGYWNTSLVWLGLLYGGFFGAFVGPIAYALVVRKIGFQKALWPAFVGTLVGGLAGAVAGPPVAALTGISGFFVGVYRAKAKHLATNASGSH